MIYSIEKRHHSEDNVVSPPRKVTNLILLCVGRLLSRISLPERPSTVSPDIHLVVQFSQLGS